MQFHFTEEQSQFRDMLRRFLDDASPTTAVRRLMASESGYDVAVWQRLAQELGLSGLTIDEQYGGAGFGMVEAGIAMEEMGRVLLCAPYLASAVLAADAVARIATDAQKQSLLPSLAEGRTIATLAFAEHVGGFALESIATQASRSGAAYAINGSKHYVVDGCSADRLLVVARAPGSHGLDGLSLFLVSPNDAGVARRALRVIDPTRKLAAIELNNANGQLLGTAGAAGPLLLHTLDRANVALANEMVGGAARLLEDTIEYTKLRVQFGRTIASFQAIKHRCAEMLLQVELAKSAAYYAAEAVDAGDAQVGYLASLAKACAGDAYVHTAMEAIQLHGGIGFTADNDTHLWFKRAKSSEVLFGDGAWHRERMIALLDKPDVSMRSREHVA